MVLDATMASTLTSNVQRDESGFAARNLALTLLLEIDEKSAYANLLVPSQLRTSTLEARDKAFVTELVYGTLRKEIFYDRVIEQASKRRIKMIDPIPLRILRLTAHQLLTLDTPAHAAVDSAVRLTVKNRSGSASGFVNAVSRRISERSQQEWLSLLTKGLDETAKLEVEFAHPAWIIKAYQERLGNLERVREELTANNENPQVSAVIYPGYEWSTNDLDKTGTWISAARFITGNPENLVEIKNGTAGIQDEGSYLVTQALAQVDTSSEGMWLDMCAGPGGKAALFSRWAIEAGRNFCALEISEHRAALIKRVTRNIVIADGTKPPISQGSAGKILLDAPCSGLGALRRRPDARLRKKPNQIPELVAIQRALIASAVECLAEGGILGYVTCSPLKAETIDNREWLLQEFPEMTLIDARPFFPSHMTELNSFDIQLWPGLHKTDAMYLALFKKR